MGSTAAHAHVVRRGRSSSLFNSWEPRRFAWSCCLLLLLSLVAAAVAVTQSPQQNDFDNAKGSGTLASSGKIVLPSGYCRYAGWFPETVVDYTALHAA